MVEALQGNYAEKQYLKGMSVPLYLYLKKRKKQGITYQDFSPSPHASLWLIASCHPSSCNPPRLKDDEDVSE